MPQQALVRLVRLSWSSTMVIWAALIAQQAWDLARFDAPWPAWLLRTLPLLAFLPVLLKRHRLGLIWLCIVDLLYFVWSVEAAFALSGDRLAQAGLALTVLLFTSIAGYLTFSRSTIVAE